MTPPESKQQITTIPTGFASKTVSHSQLYRDALNKRGIDAAAERTLGLEFWDAEATHKFLGFGSFPSIKIPYFGFDGKPSNFVRVRKLIDDGGKMKYSQPRASGVGIYLTPGQNWNDIAKNANHAIIITEGEFKAWATQQAADSDEKGVKGIAVIGLAGVTSWGSKTGKPLHEDLMRIRWSMMEGMNKVHRRVYIIFDYDGKGEDGEPNAQVGMAERKLATVLRGLGAEVHMCRVGRFALDPRNKYAIDDHLQSGRELGEVLAATAVIMGKDDNEDTRKYEFGTKYGFMPGGRAINLENGFVTSVHNASIDTAHIYYDVPAPTQANPTKTKRISMIDLSKEWDRKTWIVEKGMYPQYQGLQITPEGCYNVFKDWAHAPMLGDVTPFLELCKYFFQADPEFETQYHDWIAHILQKPWLRHYTTIQFISEEEGIGKSFMAEIAAKIIGTKGENAGAAFLGPDQLFSQWSDMLAGKVLVVVNEPSSDKSNHSAKLKDLITGDSLHINKKYGESYSIQNYVNYMFTTNKPFVTQMSKGSRRERIFRPEGIDRVEMGVRINKLNTWLDNGGYSKLLNWYLERDLTGFDHTAQAPDSRAKRLAQEDSMTDVEMAVKAFADWIESVGGDVALTFEVRVQLMKRLYEIDVTSPQAFSREIKKYCRVESFTVYDEGKRYKVNRYTHKGVTKLSLVSNLPSQAEIYRKTCKEVEKMI